jgi:carbonic anhydrase
MIGGCSDSRVSPEVIFDARPGEVFVMRNVANLIPPYDPDGDYHGTSAALEYGVQALQVQHLVVLGHARCGGVRAYAGGGGPPLSAGDFIGKWVSLLEPAARAIPEERRADIDSFASLLEVASLERAIVNLRTYPYILERERAGTLTLTALFFDIATGVLSHFDGADLRPVIDAIGAIGMFRASPA